MHAVSADDDQEGGGEDHHEGGYDESRRWITILCLFAIDV